MDMLWPPDSRQVPAPHTTQAYGKGALNLTLHSIATKDTVLVVKHPAP